jgi:hypothetical protein
MESITFAQDNSVLFDQGVYFSATSGYVRDLLAHCLQVSEYRTGQDCERKSSNFRLADNSPRTPYFQYAMPFLMATGRLSKRSDRCSLNGDKSRTYLTGLERSRATSSS